MTLNVVLMALIALGAGFMMQGFGSIVTTTVVALIAFALAGYVRAVTMGGQNASAFASKDWHNFQDLHMMTLLAYAVTFAVVIAMLRSAASGLIDTWLLEPSPAAMTNALLIRCSIPSAVSRVASPLRIAAASSAVRSNRRSAPVGSVAS